MLYKKFQLPIFLKEGLIIDIEATGSPSKGGKIITFGYCVNDFIEIFQLEDESKKEVEEMWKGINHLKEELKKNPRKLIGYNVKNAEEQWLGMKFDLDLFDWLKEWSKKANLKWPKLREVSSSFLDYYERGSIIKGIFGESETLDEVIKERGISKVWQDYLKSKDKNVLNTLMEHNARDIFKTLSLYIEMHATEYFPINEKGKIINL
jgi:hypothetical protein